MSARNKWSEYFLGYNDRCAGKYNFSDTNIDAIIEAVGPLPTTPYETGFIEDGKRVQVSRREGLFRLIEDAACGFADDRQLDAQPLPHEIVKLVQPIVGAASALLEALGAGTSRDGRPIPKDIHTVFQGTSNEVMAQHLAAVRWLKNTAEAAEQRAHEQASRQPGRWFDKSVHKFMGALMGAYSQIWNSPLNGNKPVLFIEAVFKQRGLKIETAMIREYVRLRRRNG